MIKKLSVFIVPSLLISSFASFAGDMGPIPELAPSGFYLGLGGSYNSIYLQNRFGYNASSAFLVDGVVTSTAFTNFGSSDTDTYISTFAPEVQAGYFQFFNNCDWLWGAKFLYQYIGLNTNVFASSFAGGFSADPSASGGFSFNVKNTLDHELALIPMLGHSFTNNQAYFGIGPSLMQVRTKLANTSAFNVVNPVEPAVLSLNNFNGDFNRTDWVWGGAAQVGFSHFFSPTWFVDFNYTYAFTGNSHYSNGVSLVNSIIDPLGTGTGFGSNAFYILNNNRYVAVQSMGFSVNKLFA